MIAANVQECTEEGDKSVASVEGDAKEIRFKLAGFVSPAGAGKLLSWPADLSLRLTALTTRRIELHTLCRCRTSRSWMDRRGKRLEDAGSVSSVSSIKLCTACAFTSICLFVGRQSLNLDYRERA